MSFRQALRAHSVLLVTAAVAGACLAVLAPPAPVTSHSPSTTLQDATSSQHSRYAATSVLGVPPLSQSSNPEAQFATLAFYLKSTKITQAFARRLRVTGDDPSLVSRLISVRTDPKTATVTVRGLGGSPQQAADVTNAFVTTVRDYIVDVQDSSSAQALKDARASVDSLKHRIDKLGDRIDKLQAQDETPRQTDPRVTVLQAQHDALVASYIAAYQRYSRVSAGPGPVLALTVLQPATAANARAVSPSLVYSLPLRLLLGLFLGLLVGAAAALLLEQYGRKVTTRATAEEEFRAPVLAEIPKRGFAVPVLTAGSQSPAAAEYRRLRATLLFADARDGHRGGAHRADPLLPPPVPNGVPSGVTAEVHQMTSVEDVPARNGSVSGPPVVAPGPPAARSATPAHAGVVDLETRSVAATARSNGKHVSARLPESPWPDPPEPGVPVIVLATTASERSHPVVVANVGGSFAESGWDVVVLRCGPAALDHSADGIHGRLPGLDLNPTPLPGVRAADWVAGDPVPTATDAVEHARARSDLVVVDVGRVDSAEYAEVAATADGVVMVCELGSTARDSARHSADVIERSRARFYGVVLTQVPVSWRDRLRSMRRRRSPLHLRRGQAPAS
jgi:capsular polysaccharide biosynthesis protein